jgi:methyl-accepting chemotaxis protein
MSLLARVKIMTKILAVIMLLAAVAAGTSWLGIRAMSSMNDDAETMASTAKRALEAARASTSLITLSSAEFQVALDPRPENRAIVHKLVDEQIKLFKERVEDFSKTRDEKTRAMMPAIKEAMAAYEKDMEKTLRLADETRDVQLSEQVERLRTSAMSSQVAAVKLRAELRAAAEQLDNRVNEFAKQASEEYLATSNQLMIVAAIGIILGVLAGYLIGQFGIVKPINLLKSVMEAFAHNNLTAEVPGTDRRDELGDMARTVEVFKKNGLEVERMRADQLVTEKRNTEQRKADMYKLADDFEGAVGEIIETVSSAERAQELTTMVAAASEEASTNVQSVASATEELTSSVNEISRQVQESARMAGEAVDQARKTNDRVGELSKAAARIGDVVELINTIAGQTNLLALNATIEAARAGEAGRGFAVVASEVKALAEQTAKATGEIGQQISGIQAATQESVGAIKEISGTIERLSEISSTIAAAVEEQGAATQEISRNVQQAALGTQQVSSNITDVQRGASETGSASSQVLSAAQSLSGDSNRLKLEVGKFLHSVRAA